MYRIGMIGDYDSICGFSALGVDIFPTHDAEEAREFLHKLAGSGYGVVYVTEPILAKLWEEYEYYQNMTGIAVVPIPALSGEEGLAEAAIRKYVKQAVGSDIILGVQK
jgi:V/A-type H+-transporting ATPase subunit F